jgi:hypothetical protein
MTDHRGVDLAGVTGPLPRAAAIYEWMTEHAPSFEYIRTVSKEHWHWQYQPTEAADIAKTGKFKRAGGSL